MTDFVYRSAGGVKLPSIKRLLLLHPYHFRDLMLKLCNMQEDQTCAKTAIDDVVREPRLLVFFKDDGGDFLIPDYAEDAMKVPVPLERLQAISKILSAADYCQLRVIQYLAGLESGEEVPMQAAQVAGYERILDGKTLYLPLKKS